MAGRRSVCADGGRNNVLKYDLRSSAYGTTIRWVGQAYRTRDRSPDLRRRLPRRRSINSMALLAVVLAGLILRCTRVDCSFAFPSTSSGSGALAGLDLYAPPVTSFLGPQPGDPGGTARSGPVVLFNGDMCRPTTLDVPGGVVFVSADAFSNAGCPFETRYLAMYASGAVAVICRDPRCRWCWPWV